ncbi:hypothetical protein SCHPADRAFT_547586 [Schizopora paradoxa]|uniref:Uncharacterized protein n=1 Tax=Schizopora paradoxa TaxID=27342 RepID=A0A0H2RK70_9AGAM|nr:hypothetical protein SCHPADRAFT_547586 [Schizopora paradoxa]
MHYRVGSCSWYRNVKYKAAPFPRGWVEYPSGMTTMKSFEVLALVALLSLCYSPAYASSAYFKNYIENDVKVMVINDPGMFHSAAPQLRTTIDLLLRRQSCSAGNFLCGSTCISTSYTCCIDTRTNTPSGWCTMPNPSCCLNIGTGEFKEYPTEVVLLN